MGQGWKAESVKFDELYSSGGWESKVPYFGNMVQRRLAEREQRALEFAGNIEGKTILDLGCGVGRFAVRAAAAGATVYGYDISRGAIEMAKEKALRFGVEDRCFFEEADLAQTDFPAADLWYDLGCLQYIFDLAPILARLTHVSRFFSALPQRGHWQNIPRLVYRGWIKRNPYRTYTESEIRELFGAWGDIRIQRHGLALNITSKD
jgi:SAM-dependent methyltransferase